MQCLIASPICVDFKHGSIIPAIQASRSGGSEQGATIGHQRGLRVGPVRTCYHAVRILLKPDEIIYYVITLRCRILCLSIGCVAEHQRPGHAGKNSAPKPTLAPASNL